MDLSLFNNQISKIENLDTLVNLNVLSLGAWARGKRRARVAGGGQCGTGQRELTMGIERK